MSIESVMPSNHLVLCHPLFLLPSIFPSIRVFSNESGLHIRWPKYWSFSFSISPFNEYLGMISLQLTSLISLQSRDSQESSPTPQFKSINSLALSLLYGPTLTSIHDYWKNHSLDYTDHCRQRSLLFSMLSTFVIAFLPRSKCLNELILSLYADSLTRIPLYRRNCFSFVVFKFFSLTYDN